MFKKFFRNEVIVPLKYTEELKAAYSSGSVTGGKLKNKTALITGANGGIGLSLCLRYAKEGCNVIFTVRSEKNRRVTYEYLRKNYPEGKYFGYLLDLCCVNSIEQFLLECSDINIDIVINNAGVLSDIDRNGLFRKVKKEYFEKSFNTNLIGMKILTDSIIKKAKENDAKCSIINITSICSLYKNFQFTPYGISKSGVSSYTKVFKKKYPDFNIHAIAPGCVATGMVNYKLGDDLSYGHNILQRVALTEEIASLSAFLSSDYGRYISNTPIIASAGEVL